MNNKLGVVLFLGFFGTVCLSAQRMETYGDSISAGFLSQTDVTNAPPLKEVSVIVSDLVSYLINDRNPRYIEAHHAPDLAWPALVSKKMDPAGPAFLENHSVTGARVAQLIDQVAAQPRRTSPARAFFFIGHNDICNNNNAPAAIGKYFEDQVDMALDDWDSLHRNSTAYLIPVGEIHRVYAVLQGYIWHRGKKNYTCEDSWSKWFPFCPSHLAKAKTGVLDGYMIPRLAAMNRALKRLASQWTKTSRTNRFVYLDGAHDIVYEPKFFAIDCFHLSAEGQKTIADRIITLVQRAEKP